VVIVGLGLLTADVTLRINGGPAPRLLDIDMIKPASPMHSMRVQFHGLLFDLLAGWVDASVYSAALKHDAQRSWLRRLVCFLVNLIATA
jgi:hypothetical protein